MTAPRTKTQDVFNGLSLEIAQGRLPPGASLDETSIAERYGVSRTPIREAIRQLEMAGLVEARPHRGALVKAVAEQQLDDMFAVMAELEGLCARWSSIAMTRAERAFLQAIHDRSAALVKAGDQDGYIAVNDEFHTAIYAGAHNGYLEELTQAARRRVAPFRRAQFSELDRLTRSHAEHGLVVRAIQRGDGDTAYRVMRAHLGVVRTAVENVSAAPAPWGSVPPKE